MEVPFVRRLILSRNIQAAPQFVNFVLFILVIIAGIRGIDVGARNLSIVFTWIVWSPLLAIVLTPLFGRGWCYMCPIVWPGELIQRGLWSRFSRPMTLRRRWPKRLSNVWLQNIIFLVFAAWIVILSTRPSATALAVVILIVTATVTSALFPRRVFCRYICPPGMFIGLFSGSAPLEVRVKDRDVCLVPPSEGGCRKECYVGSERGYGCPWYEFPQNMNSGFDCGLCMECFKTCPKDNVRLSLRGFGGDLTSREVRRGPGEVWRVLIMLSIPIFYTAVLYGPWSWLKDAGNLLLFSSSVGLADHVFYFALLIDVALGVVPGMHLLASAAAKRLSDMRGISVSRLYAHYALAYVPLGLMLWLGFNVDVLMTEWSYIPGVLSDPFGFGWDLFGTKVPWAPIGWPIPYIEAALVWVGVYLSLRTGYERLKWLVPEDRALKALAPFTVLTCLVAIAYLWFYL